MADHTFSDFYCERDYNDAGDYINALNGFDLSRLTNKEKSLLHSIKNELFNYQDRLIELDKLIGGEKLELEE